MVRIWQIGTIIRFLDVEAMIIGHQAEEKDDRYVMYYIITMYPSGFLGMKTVGKIPVDTELTVIKEGYLNTTGRLYIENKQRFYDTSLKYTIKEWDKCLGDIVEKANELEANLYGEK